ncbi:MAG: hypothetical protein KKE39_05910 [Bacteroidetes bacterium]|nr:hypothetical protein [Bacteroidota bacterium]MBU1371384.1 hypothetical protein [Bacteroidota bacterium]MBU1485872.1 hypothetical protein [Bacteroidota bacterium]MBU1761459.1 hypothetical protein [Bacteroidota bacterium]MBU2267168.1 hypothetical protein [Bacteroidota bacterium]
MKIIVEIYLFVLDDGSDRIGTLIKNITINHLQKIDQMKSLTLVDYPCETI